MTDWISQYSAALDERDAREQAHKPYINAYTKLADRAAAVLAQPAGPPPPLSPQRSGGKERTGTPVKGRQPSSQEEPDPNDALQRLRADLATTQKARQVLQTQVTDLTTTLKDLQLQQKASTAQITQLARQKAELERKLKDREEEIRLKGKMVEQAQDEQVALGLQLNMAEGRSEKLEKENKELIDRWMKRIGEEAEKVNRESKWE